jgi:glucokinase
VQKLRTHKFHFMKQYAIGADIGGTHITTAVVNLQTGKIVDNTLCRLAVEATGSQPAILQSWTQAVDTTLLKATHSEPAILPSHIAGVGIAMPGPFDYDKGICLIIEQPKYRALYGVNIRHELSSRWGMEPANIRFRNDAECFLLGEVFGTQAQGQRFLGITLGTGFGSAYLLNGQSEDGKLWCAPFREGTAEDYLSTRWFEHRYQALTGKEIAGVKYLADHFQDDTTARELFLAFGSTLGEFLRPLIDQHLIDTVIIGGNIALSYDLFAPPLAQALEKTARPVRLVKAALGENAALTGGASLLNHRKNQ